MEGWILPTGLVFATCALESVNISLGKDLKKRAGIMATVEVGVESKQRGKVAGGVFWISEVFFY